MHVRLRGASERDRGLIVACGAHVLHDGYTDLIYVMLPIWQHDFALSLATVGLLRTVYTGAMATFQLPSSLASERISPGLLLALGTAFSAGCYAVASTSSTYVALALALLAGGLGSSVQHPLASNIVARCFEGARSRAALGTYNFAGDLGKMALPALVGALLFVLPWRHALWVVSALGIVVAIAIFAFAPRLRPVQHDVTREPQEAGNTFTRGFTLLLLIGAVDSAARMGFLTFLPFVLTHKGAAPETIAFCLTLLFAGGALGKFACGFLGARIGTLGTVCITEGLTAIGVIALMPLGFSSTLFALPLLGIVLNGTSSVLYGSVPEVIAPQLRQRAFGVFYTGTIAAGAVAPFLAGIFSDAYGVPALMFVVALFVLTTIPLAILLVREGRAPVARVAAESSGRDR